MSQKKGENENSRSAKVIQLGFNISVTGDEDFDIVVEDKKEGNVDLSENQSGDLPQLQDFSKNASKAEVEWKKKSDNEINPDYFQDLNNKNKSSAGDTNLSKSHGSSSDYPEYSGLKEFSLESDIKKTMECFEKFSDHIKEIPRFKMYPVASSTPFYDKESSKSESNIYYPDKRSRKHVNFYDYNSRRDFNRGKPWPSDLFLRPLPGADLYKRGMVRRYDYEPIRIYGSVDSLAKPDDNWPASYSKSSFNEEKFDYNAMPLEVPSNVFKKKENDSNEKSTASTESVKDIKIYQNGGILIMQNFKENLDLTEKQEISDFSAKLIENCRKLGEEINNRNIDFKEKSITGNSSEESQNSGKIVHFDLPGSDYQKFKFNILNSSPISKDSALENQVSHDFPSMSTQDNDSIISNQPGMSPVASGKKLEWDSGADVGYLNLDFSKENLSTIERIVLRGLSADGFCEKNEIQKEKSEGSHFSLSKIVSEKKFPEIIIEEMTETKHASDIKKNIRSSIKKSQISQEQVYKTRKEMEKKIGNRKESKQKQESEKITKCKSELKSREFFARVPKEEYIQNIKQNGSQLKVQNKVDKIVNVNTLFPNEIPQSIPETFTNDGKLCNRSLKLSNFSAYESKVSPKSKKKGRFIDQKIQTSRISATAKDSYRSRGRRYDKVDFTGLKMGLPKKLYKKVRAKPELSYLECSRETEEIIVDHSYKKNDESSEEEKSLKNESEADNQSNDKKLISGGLTEAVALNGQKHSPPKTKKGKEITLVDQTIQTNEFKVDSVGIQAFENQMSSISDSSDSKIAKASVSKPPKTISNISSKNIQAFGLNSSLPRELAHSKEIEHQRALNTKSTQFFGGPINSLPNYHSNLTSKAVESCGKMFKVLKSKEIESKVINMIEENRKNIMANDNTKKIMANNNTKNDSTDDFNIPENKENIMTIKTIVSQQFSSISDKKNSREFEKKEAIVNTSENHRAINNDGDFNKLKQSKIDSQKSFIELDFDSYEYLLTSKHLKEHGDNIDRNLIQEKYFRSQLAEIEGKQMISKSTSMDFEGKEYLSFIDKVDTACQYSLGKTDSGNEVTKSRKGSVVDKKSDSSAALGRCDSSFILVQKQQNESSKSTGFETGDSLTSSIKTANNWMPEEQDLSQNIASPNASAVGRARSFEYLPGSMYQRNENTKENSPPEDIVIEDTSSALSEEDSMRTRGERSSEGRKTLILENSNESSWDSSRLKSLDENLTQLNVVVTRLKEKDSQIQKITRSVLVNLWRHSGCGDGPENLGTDTPRTKINDKRSDERPQEEEDQSEKYSALNHQPQGNSSLDRNLRKSKNQRKDKSKLLSIKGCSQKDSIACQTEAKSPEYNLKKYQEERKALESRLAADKESQIKWIEKEIYHLNILRDILEKQNSLCSRKKKTSSLNAFSDNSQGDLQNYSKDNSPVTNAPPICDSTTSSLEKNNVSGKYPMFFSAEEKLNDKMEDDRKISTIFTEANNTKYGMAVSLNGNLRKVTLLPVGVKLSLNSTELNENHFYDEVINEKIKKYSPCSCSIASQRTNQNQNTSSSQHRSDVATQNSSSGSPYNKQWKSIDEEAPFMKKGCNDCHQRNCVCLSLSQSEKTERSSEIYSKATSSQTKDSSKPCLESPTSAKYSFGHKANSNSTDTNTAKMESLSGKNRKSRNAKENSQNVMVINNPEKDLACSCKNCPKSSTGTCHVIKIIGPTCCLPSKNGTLCSCKRKRIKKTENQSCQTDDVVIENKILVLNSELSKPNKQAEVICPAENKIAVEKKQSIDEKYLCDSKILLKKIQPEETRVDVEEKRVLQNDVPENKAHTTTKTPFSIPHCECQGKRETSKPNDYPRHYFLKIEETEIDEINESMERRKSIEVITVKVPVKKAGKAKIYGKDLRHTTNSIQQTPVIPTSSKLKKNDCIGCKNCFEKESLTPAQDYSNQRVNDFQKANPQKSGFYNKTKKLYEKIDCKSTDEIELDCSKTTRKDPYIRSYSAEENYCECPHNLAKNGVYRLEQGIHENSAFDSRSTDELKNFLKETPSDYDSHKDYRPQLHCLENDSDKRKQSHVQNGMRHCLAEEPFEKTTDYRTFKPQKFLPEFDRYQSDYYNYNRKEFMTKSELLKEEQKKKKTNHPSLQEYLESNRPDFCSSAESRRQVILERAKERVKNQGNRMECFMNMMHQCNSKNVGLKKNGDTKWMFTTPQMREQTLRKYKQLPEVTEKVADRKKKEEYRTNKLMADIFAKKLQLEALKGHINLSNSVTVLSMI